MENKKINKQEISNTGVAINSLVAVKVFNYYKLLADDDVIRHMQRAEWIYQGRNDVIQISKGKNTQDIKNYNDTISELNKLGIMVSENVTEKRIKHFTINKVLMQKMNDLSVHLLSTLYTDKEIVNVAAEMYKLLKLFTGTHLDIVNNLAVSSKNVDDIRKAIFKEYYHTSAKIGELSSEKIIERTNGQMKDKYGDLKDDKRIHFYKQNDWIVRSVSDYLNHADDILKKYRIPESIK